MAHLSLTLPTRVICGETMLASPLRNENRLVPYLRDLVSKSLSIRIASIRQGGGLTVCYAPYYNHIVNLLLTQTRRAHCLLDQGEVQIKPISQACRSLGSSSIWRYDHCLPNIDIVSDPTEIAWLMTVSPSNMAL